MYIYVLANSVKVRNFSRGAAMVFYFLCKECEHKWEFRTMGTQEDSKKQNVAVMAPILLTGSQPSKVKR